MDQKCFLWIFPYVCFAFRYVLHKVYVSPSDRSVAPDKDIAKHATEVDFPLLQIWSQSSTALDPFARHPHLIFKIFNTLNFFDPRLVNHLVEDQRVADDHHENWNP